MRAAFVALWLAAPAAAAGPIETFTLPNGMRVVLAADRSVPVVTLAMIFDVGGRQEQPGRSGFAHLFEHLMFEGSRNAPRGSFDRVLETYGGDNNASTHEDFTFYYEVLPSNALPIALWLDADRLSALSITEGSLKTQVSVVSEEKRQSVDNQPYAPLLYIEISSRSFVNWTNGHSTIGSFEDLSAATLQDVKDFFSAYYSPANAWLAVVGDIDPAEARVEVERYFAWIPNLGTPKPVDTAEPDQTAARRFTIADEHANLPAVAISWTGMPRRRAEPDFYALGLLGRALLYGKSSRLYQALVKEAQTAISVDGGLGFPVSDMEEYKHPGLFSAFVVHKASVTAEAVRTAIFDEIGRVARDGIPAAELERVKTKLRSDRIVAQQTTLGRANVLLQAALLDGSPQAAEGELGRYLAVTPAQVQKAAARYFAEERSNTFEVKVKTAEAAQ
ncbi:MAG: insulinase family protein [Elusimicrobia bacterium]|nr:insulinase family protein [Elusimicrobiota bacterium]